MIVERLDVYTYRLDHHYKIAGHHEAPGRLPGTDYYVEPHWRHAYSRKTESCLIKLTTDDGLTGWGEAQAPLLPETPSSILTGLVGPAVLGQDPRRTEVIYETLCHLMHVRGQSAGFMLDAVAAVDIAAWDLAGKHYEVPICELLGGPFRTELPAYVSGLRHPTLQEQCQAARKHVETGFVGIKLFLGHSVEGDRETATALREAIGPELPLMVDLLCKYRLPEALRLGRALDELGIAWLEAPVDPRDIHGHRELAVALDAPIAIGEPLRSVHEFFPWLEARALGIAQPDVVRCGITAARKIANLAEAHHVPVALHLGVSTGIGVAATWQLAAALPSFFVQEYQLSLADSASRMLCTPLVEESGRLIVPRGPGLGIEVDEPFVTDHATQHWIVDHQGARLQ